MKSLNLFVRPSRAWDESCAGHKFAEKDWAGNNSVKWRTDTGFTNELHACIISSGTQGLGGQRFPWLLYIPFYQI